MNVLTLNAGSSSLKFKLLRMAGDESVLAQGQVDQWGTPKAAMRLEVTGRAAETTSVAAESVGHAVEHAIGACRPMGIDAVGHRIVHGGSRFEAPARISDEVIAAIREVTELAPLQNGPGLVCIETQRRLLPDVPAFAVFDTAFHRTIPDVAATYAIPLEVAQKHEIRRYGFHGTSHRYVSQTLLAKMGRAAAGTRLITCHLGNGASVCAIRDGASIDTSMGMTPLEGLVMGTRCGDIDPGLLMYLMRTERISVRELDDLLNRHSGLLGLSGKSSDVRELQALAGGDARAELALEIFAYRVRKYIGAYAAILGGLDAIAFSGGIGEHSSDMRQRICRGLEFLGAELDSSANAAASGKACCKIGTDKSRVQIWVIPTDEELQIGRDVRELLQKPN
jgi:acetate kinase